jgi:metal-responsive CopG/Arc/MetJ family transcriptional regulator
MYNECRGVVIMKRTQISLPQQMIDKLDKTAKEKGISHAELIRRIIDQYYDRK